MRFTRQFDQMDCGPACIRMVASAYGKDYPLSYLRSLSHLTREGVSVAGIRHALGEIGMESATFEMTIGQLREKCPLPAILHWEQNHFVVLYDVKKSRWTGKWKYCVANPAYGKHAFSEETFSHFWLNGSKGVAIGIEPREDFFDRKPVRERHSLLRFARKYVWPFRWELSQSAFGMLSGMLLSLVTPPTHTSHGRRRHRDARHGTNPEYPLSPSIHIHRHLPHGTHQQPCEPIYEHPHQHQRAE